MQSYAQALELYNSRPVPPRSKAWKAMADNARPLRRTGDTNKGIHMTDEGVIYFRLYDTKLVTLHPPQADGTYRVEVRWYDSQTTRNFMSDFGLYYVYLLTTDNTRVYVPLVPTSRPCADLTFTADNKLITARSWHADIYTAVSSAEDKQRRREFKAKLDTLTTLAMLKLENYRANVTIEASYGKPFASGWRLPDSVRLFEHKVHEIKYRTHSRDPEDFDFNDPEFIEALLNAGQGVFDILASKRMWGENCFYHRFKSKEAQEEALKQQIQIINSVTPEDLSKSLHNKLLSLFNLKKGSDRKAWGQFQPSLPRKYSY